MKLLGTKGALLIWIAKKCSFFFICGWPQWNVEVGAAPHPAVGLSHVNLNYHARFATDLKADEWLDFPLQAKFFNTSCFFFLLLSSNPLCSFLNWISAGFSNLNLVSGSRTSQVATRQSGSCLFLFFFFVDRLFSSSTSFSRWRGSTLCTRNT